VVLVREMNVRDLPALIELQQAGAVVGLADVFPQDRYPFPRDALIARWREEIADGEIRTRVALDDDGRLVGFAAMTGEELLHFGTAVDTWGDGTASALLGVVVAMLRTTTDAPTLRVFADNRRGRRFYEKHGWRPTGAQSTGTFEPQPVLLEYSLPPLHSGDPSPVRRDR